MSARQTISDDWRRRQKTLRQMQWCSGAAGLCVMQRACCAKQGRRGGVRLHCASGSACARLRKDTALKQVCVLGHDWDGGYGVRGEMWREAGCYVGGADLDHSKSAAEDFYRPTGTNDCVKCLENAICKKGTTTLTVCPKPRLLGAAASSVTKDTVNTVPCTRPRAVQVTSTFGTRYLRRYRRKVYIPGSNTIRTVPR